METAALVAPITGLEFLQDKFLLTGKLNFFFVFNLQVIFSYVLNGDDVIVLIQAEILMGKLVDQSRRTL